MKWVQRAWFEVIFFDRTGVRFSRGHLTTDWLDWTQGARWHSYELASINRGRYSAHTSSALTGRLSIHIINKQLPRRAFKKAPGRQVHNILSGTLALLPRSTLRMRNESSAKLVQLNHLLHRHRHSLKAVFKVALPPVKVDISANNEVIATLLSDQMSDSSFLGVYFACYLFVASGHDSPSIILGRRIRVLSLYCTRALFSRSTTR